MATRQQAKRVSAVSAPKRKRRSTEEIVNLIADSAVAEFGENGYANTTTAAIARRAGVVEALIFNHFGSKANLFRKAVYKALDDQFQTFLATHHNDGAGDAELHVERRAYVSDLVNFVRSHADLFKSLIVNETSAYGKDENRSAGLLGLQDYFDKMSELESVRLNRQPNVSPHLIARISFATIVACIMFDDWLFPAAIGSEQEIHEALCDFVIEGANVNTPMQRPALPPARAGRRR